MVLKMTSISSQGLCGGNTWEVIDRESLILYLSLAALGRARHVDKIVGGGTQLNIPDRSFAAAIKKFDLTKDNEPFHRDGWIFQVISWLAAKQTDPGKFLTAPHIMRADKGLDGLLIELDAAGENVIAAVVFEDKATTSPRNTIHTDVWPELQSFEDGDRDDLLTDGISALLQTSPNLNAEEIVNRVLWEKVLHYRVSITIGDSHAKPDGYTRLFDGYDEIIPGPDGRRRGEVFYCEDLRRWMSDLASDCVRKLEEMREGDV